METTDGAARFHSSYVTVSSTGLHQSSGNASPAAENTRSATSSSTMAAEAGPPWRHSAAEAAPSTAPCTRLRRPVAAPASARVPAEQPRSCPSLHRRCGRVAAQTGVVSLRPAARIADWSACGAGRAGHGGGGGARRAALPGAGGRADPDRAGIPAGGGGGGWRLDGEGAMAAFDAPSWRSCSSTGCGRTEASTERQGASGGSSRRPCSSTGCGRSPVPERGLVWSLPSGARLRVFVFVVCGHTNSGSRPPPCLDNMR